MSERTKVSRSEELLYEAYAPLVRRLGRAVEELELARSEVEAILAGSREADGFTQGTVDKGVGWDPETGTTPETRFREGLFSRVFAVADVAYGVHREVAHECGGRVIDQRRHVDSQPAPAQLRAGEVVGLPLDRTTLAEVGAELHDPSWGQGLGWFVAGGDTYTRAITLHQTCPEVARYFNEPLGDEQLRAHEWMVRVPAGVGG